MRLDTPQNRVALEYHPSTKQGKSKKVKFQVKWPKKEVKVVSSITEEVPDEAITADAELVSSASSGESGTSSKDTSGTSDKNSSHNGSITSSTQSKLVKYWHPFNSFCWFSKRG